MVDISSGDKKINITVSTSGNKASVNATPDTAMYYSNKSREWAISDRIVDNEDYSSKYYAQKSKEQAQISTNKTEEVVNSGNEALSNIDNAKENALTDITNLKDTSLSNIETSKTNAISDITNQETLSVDNVNTAGETQVNLAKEQATIATTQAGIATAKTNEVIESGNSAITAITEQETTSKNNIIAKGAEQIELIQKEGATQIANVQSTGFYMRDDKLYFINSQGEETEFKSGGSGLEVCDIGMGLYVDETKGLRRYLNGQIVDINANTQAFLDRLKDITTLHPSLLCTEDEWQTAKTMSAFGQVGKFVFNYSGDEIVSVRIPAIVNIQGVFDLQNLGMTVSAGLPNITGYGTGNVIPNTEETTYYGALYKYTSGGAYGNTSANGFNRYNIGFDASRSSSIYGKSNTVQQEAIQYPYFIQIATGSETENNIVNDIELNNPYSLFDSKYSDHVLNNLSWLKSEGQWNAKAVYPDAYDKTLENVNKSVKGFLGQTMYMWGSASGGYMTTSLTPVVGSAIYEYTSKKFVGYVTGVDSTIPAISFRDDVAGISYTNITRYAPSDESSSAYITDYDFVLNTADETFRLPLLDGSEDLPSNNVIYYTANTSLSNTTPANVYTATQNCYVTIRTFSPSSTGISILSYINGIVVYTQSFGATFNQNSDVLFMQKGQTLSLGVTSGSASYNLTVRSAQGNGTLYYYVGETVQNANLIDAGRIGEQLANKQDKCIHITETYQNGNSWYRVWSDGWCEQSGKTASMASNEMIAVTFLKKFKNTNISVILQRADAGFGNYTPSYKYLTISGMNIWNNDTSNNASSIRWYVRGYLAEGEY